jgi:hypothetical protein
MELSYLVLTGSLSGLLSVLAHSVAGSAIELVRGPSAATDSMSLQISEALLHAICGVGLALLFWLSWGLAAVVDVGWWVRGVSFAVLCWSALALPGVISFALARKTGIGVAAMMAARWATTCLIAGLACAWSWERAM